MGKGRVGCVALCVFGTLDISLVVCREDCTVLKSEFMLDPSSAKIELMRFSCSLATIIRFVEKSQTKFNDTPSTFMLESLITL